MYMNMISTILKIFLFFNHTLNNQKTEKSSLIWIFVLSVLYSKTIIIGGFQQISFGKLWIPLFILY